MHPQKISDEYLTFILGTLLLFNSGDVDLNSTVYAPDGERKVKDVIDEFSISLQYDCAEDCINRLKEPLDEIDILLEQIENDANRNISE